MCEKEKTQLVAEVNILRELRNPFIVRYHDRIVDKVLIVLGTKYYHIRTLENGSIYFKGSLFDIGINSNVGNNSPIYNYGVLRWWRP